MSETRHSVFVDAPPTVVYAALLDPTLIPQWRVPEGMRCHIHTFDAREGGLFRVSLTYDAPDATGKSSAHTDTYHGRFEQLVPGELVVERMAFETANPEMQGDMLITTHLVPHDHGTRLDAVHANLPRGVSPSDNEAGWEQSLAKLAALLKHRTTASVTPTSSGH
jgi:uncharacterized protein YndB with AHSA1/START domain